MSNYFPQKVKVRHILEKFGYEYSLVDFDGKTERMLLTTNQKVPLQFRSLKMEPDHKTIWAIMYLTSQKVPDFIDYVYPFPHSYDKILDTIYDLYKKNML